MSVEPEIPGDKHSPSEDRQRQYNKVLNLVTIESSKLYRECVNRLKWECTQTPIMEKLKFPGTEICPYTEYDIECTAGLYLRYRCINSEGMKYEVKMDVEDAETLDEAKENGVSLHITKYCRPCDTDKKWRSLQCPSEPYNGELHTSIHVETIQEAQEICKLLDQGMEDLATLK